MASQAHLIRWRLWKNVAAWGKWQKRFLWVPVGIKVMPGAFASSLCSLSPFWVELVHGWCLSLFKDILFKALLPGTHSTFFDPPSKGSTSAGSALSANSNYVYTYIYIYIYTHPYLYNNTYIWYIYTYIYIHIYIYKFYRRHFTAFNFNVLQLGQVLVLRPVLGLWSPKSPRRGQTWMFRFQSGKVIEWSVYYDSVFMKVWYKLC